MSKLFVIGNCYTESEQFASELFGVLENAGYTLAYNAKSKNACTILKEIEETEEETTEE